MKIPGLACTVAMMLAGGACATDMVTLPSTAPVATRIRDCCDAEVPPPLFIVDGRIVEVGDDTEIDPADILDVKVLRGPQAVQVYGARGRYGAVLIATRPARADAGGPFAGCWLANGCADVPPPPPPPPPPRPVLVRCPPGMRVGQPPLIVVGRRACTPGACRAVSLGDITDVQVLTGPAAAAIYGSAGGGGALFLTTRHARR
jgi:hypothetical protein